MATGRNFLSCPALGVSKISRPALPCPTGQGRASLVFLFNGFLQLQLEQYTLHISYASESRSLNRGHVEDIQILLDRFLRQFCDLYTNHHNTQAVHGLQHVASSVHDFNSLGNYSTFNFENILGIRDIYFVF